LLRGDERARLPRGHTRSKGNISQVAELISVDKVPSNVFEGNRFQKLVSVLSGISAADLAKNRLLVNHRKIREKIIPRRYDEARKRLLSRADDAANICGLTVADDGFKDRRKNHVSGVTIGSPSPSVESMTIAVTSVSADSLHAFAIARGWEELVLLSQRKAPVSDYPDGYFVALPQVPVAFCSDDAFANRKARGIAALRRPRIVFIPCFAHQVALMCGDLVKRSKHAKVISQSLKLVSFFNNSYCK
jgi:hypothetical protein